MPAVSYPDDIVRRAARIRLVALDVDGVLTDGRLQFDAEGRETKVFHSRDGYGMRRLLESGVEIAVISGRSSLAVKARMAELDVRHVFLDKGDKRGPLQKTIEALELAPEEVAYVGDDLPDMDVMKSVGLAIAVADAHPEILAIADWTTTLNGGFGAVREVCDLVIAARRGQPGE